MPTSPRDLMDNGPADFVDAEVIKQKLDEILESLARVEGRIEALEAQMGADD